jgi:hypothetical protein
MRKSSRSHIKKTQYSQSQDWLPIDERLLPHIFHFDHVKGMARIFLEFEMAISLALVTMTIAAVVVKLTVK